jgi:hypothetical protein
LIASTIKGSNVVALLFCNPHPHRVVYIHIQASFSILRPRLVNTFSNDIRHVERDIDVCDPIANFDSISIAHGGNAIANIEVIAWRSIRRDS